VLVIVEAEPDPRLEDEIVFTAFMLVLQLFGRFVVSHSSAEQGQVGVGAADILGRDETRVRYLARPMQKGGLDGPWQDGLRGLR
jgi:hypothetical protein